MDSTVEKIDENTCARRKVSGTGQNGYTDILVCTSASHRVLRTVHRRFAQKFH